MRTLVQRNGNFYELYLKNTNLEKILSKLEKMENFRKGRQLDRDSQRRLRLLVAWPEADPPFFGVGLSDGFLLELLLFAFQTLDLDPPEERLGLEPLHFLVEPLPFHVVRVGRRKSPFDLREFRVDFGGLRFGVGHLDLVLFHFSANFRSWNSSQDFPRV